jgi:hypothetical protein
MASISSTVQECLGSVAAAAERSMCEALGCRPPPVWGRGDVCACSLRCGVGGGGGGDAIVSLETTVERRATPLGHPLCQRATRMEEASPERRHLTEDMMYALVVSLWQSRCMCCTEQSKIST